MKCPYPPHGSHMPALLLTIAAFRAESIIEFGAGDCSTRVLRHFARFGAMCASVEDDPNWTPVEQENLRHYTWSEFWCEMDQSLAAVRSMNLELNNIVVLVDCVANRRADAIRRSAGFATAIVVHDTEAQHEHVYGSRAALKESFGMWAHVTCPWTGIRTTIAWHGTVPDAATRTMLAGVRNLNGEEARKFHSGSCDILDRQEGVS